MRRIYQFLKFFFRPKIFVCFCVVERIVTVIRIMDIRTSIVALAITVDLLIRRTQPNCIYTKIRKIAFLNFFVIPAKSPP